MIHFANPIYFILLIVPLAMIVWYILQHRKLQAGMQVSTVQPFANLPIGWKVRLRHAPFVLRVVTILVLVLILARPQSSNSWRNTSTEGIDIMMTLDISSSMLARDFKPNRIEAAKEVASAFISGRPFDNIGLVVFSGESFTQCPLTTDHAVLLNLFSGLQSGMLEDGTAIGLGLANAVSRLKDSKAKSKVIILLTDGSNNMGNIAPVTAAEIAKTFGVRVYTIGVGTQGMAPYPVQTPFGIRYQNMPVEIDEGILKRIANMTGGSYFRATGNSKLKEIYAEIDQMEKTKLNVQEFSKKKEEYLILAWIAFGLLLMELIIRYFVLRKIP
jgi:Ca-activated chloride channel family protein